MTTGCLMQVEEKREPLPSIVWPDPPEAPRIHFVNSITKPGDLEIASNSLQRLIYFWEDDKEKSRIVKPYGIETDSAGRFYVVDSYRRLVHVFDAANNDYYTFPRSGTTFQIPIGIAIDESGTIHVSDSKEGVIKIFKENGKKYIGEIGRGDLGRPTGIAINSVTDELLVVDTLDSSIAKFGLNNHVLKGRIGKNGSEEGMFHYPTDIFVSHDGRIFVSDSLNFRVQIFTPDGKFLNTFGIAGNGPGFFSRPKGIAVDSEGNIYVVDALFDNVQIFDDKGSLLMDFGSTGNDYGEFWLPSGIFIDDSDRIYVSDTYNHRVQIFKYLRKDEF